MESWSGGSKRSFRTCQAVYRIGNLNNECEFSRLVYDGEVDLSCGKLHGTYSKEFNCLLFPPLL